MATLREIAAKGAELKTAIDTLEGLQQDKQTLQDGIAEINTTLSLQQGIVNMLKTELKAMLA